MAYQTVLVVDDEPHIVEIVHDYLKQAGFRVLTAADGQTALTLASTCRRRCRRWWRTGGA